MVTNPRIFHRTHDASAKTLNTLIFNGSIVYSPIRLDLLHSKVSCLQAVTVTTLVAFSLFSFLFLFVFSIDHTYKVYIGGAQKRPDGNYSRPVQNPSGEVIGQVADGNRKDIRDAVEAAHKAAPGCVYC